MTKSNNELIPLLYRAMLFFFNFTLFLALSSHASNFARIYSNAYHPALSQLMIFVFAIGFFILLRNLMLIVLTIEEKNEEVYMATFRKIGKLSVVVVFLLLLAQIVPEFLLSMSLTL